MKITKDQFIANRQAAGEAYRQAALALIAAWESLHAHDLVYGNANLGMSYAPRGFVGRPELPVHAEFLPDAADLYARASERAQAAIEPMINSVIND